MRASTDTAKFEHEYGSEEWEAAAGRVARSYAPVIYPCKHCGAPTVHGYCCTHCGSSEPR
jgi:hypothetical protein